ncbi:COMM domain-containing protein 3 [Entamoeba marina]
MNFPESLLTDFILITKHSFNSPQNFNTALSNIIDALINGAPLNPEFLEEFCQVNELLTKETQEILVTLYDKSKERLRGLLQTTISTLPHITGVTWKLDFFVKPNQKEINPVFLVSFQTQHNNIPGSFDFVCTHEEMQDLLTKLKDAQKQIERSASNV